MKLSRLSQEGATLPLEVSSEVLDSTRQKLIDRWYISCCWTYWNRRTGVCFPCKPRSYVQLLQVEGYVHFREGDELIIRSFRRFDTGRNDLGREERRKQGFLRNDHLLDRYFNVSYQHHHQLKA